MAVGQCNFPDMFNVAGITLGTACAGIKQAIKDDILVIQLDPEFRQYQAKTNALQINEQLFKQPIHN